ncbi:IS110 family transposase [Plebeiibacterium sediminum]|uniref:Transposase n=1 Tax=Plebeiibacterium sediminum TaxID=2992112 RepID=A0AAE3SH74_9BACT|nr:transposase [Plebeiobacterium sediminum]MCW3789270.1 transposase [Plebeiobacterium sediminum]
MQSQFNKNQFEGQSFYIGIDVHKKSWKVTILGEEYEHKSFSQDPEVKHLVSYLHNNFPGGNYHAVYEAGFSGFELSRKLNNSGVKCLVVHPADIPTSKKEKVQKTDKADSRKLARCLRSNAIDGINIPVRNLESDRALVRQRFRIVKEVGRIKNRVKSLLFQFSIEIPDAYSEMQTRSWSRNYLNWLKTVDIKETSLRVTLNNYIEIGSFLRKGLLTSVRF